MLKRFECFPSLLVFFKDPASVGLVVLKKIVFFKIPKWHYNLIGEYKRAKLTSYYLDNAAKTFSCELNIFKNIEIKHVFQSKSLFYYQISCLSVSKMTFKLCKLFVTDLFNKFAKTKIFYS